MIIPSSKYPTQVQVVANYPHGRAKNKVSESDTTGFPLEKDWVNDWLGFCQAMVVHAGITPTNTPEQVGVSQVMDAIEYLIDEVSGTKFDAAVDGLTDWLTIIAGIVTARLGTWNIPLVMQTNTSDRFEYASVSPDYIAQVLRQSSVAASGGIRIPIQPPYPNLRLSENGVVVDLIGTGHSSLPAEMPTAAVAVYRIGTGATKLGDATDTSVDVAAYETLHTITPILSARNIAANEILSVLITGEAGANSVAGLEIQAVTATFESTV